MYQVYRLEYRRWHLLYLVPTVKVVKEMATPKNWEIGLEVRETGHAMDWFFIPVYCLLNNSILLISVRWCDSPSPGRVSSEFRDCIDYERYLLRDERYWKPWTNTANKSIKFASPPKCKYKKWFYGAGWCQAPGFSGGGLGLMRQTQQAVLLVTLLIKGTDC